MMITLLVDLLRKDSRFLVNSRSNRRMGKDICPTSLRSLSDFNFFLDHLIYIYTSNEVSINLRFKNQGNNCYLPYSLLFEKDQSLDCLVSYNDIVYRLYTVPTEIKLYYGYSLVYLQVV